MLGGAAMLIGARASGPEMAWSINAMSATVRAIGPSTDSADHASALGQEGTRPGDGRKPTMLQ
jgi:hypothetical protein